MNTQDFKVVSSEPALREFEDMVQERLHSEKVEKEEYNPDMKFFVEANFHRSNLLTIKRDLGSRCRYLSHVEEPKIEKGNRVIRYFIKAIMENETGGKDTVMFQLGGKPSEMKEKDYRELYTQLKTNGYDA